MEFPLFAIDRLRCCHRSTLLPRRPWCKFGNYRWSNTFPCNATLPDLDLTIDGVGVAIRGNTLVWPSLDDGVICDSHIGSRTISFAELAQDLKKCDRIVRGLEDAKKRLWYIAQISRLFHFYHRTRVTPFCHEQASQGSARRIHSELGCGMPRPQG